VATNHRRTVEQRHLDSTGLKRRCNQGAVIFFAWRREAARYDAGTDKNRVRSQATGLGPAPLRFGRLQIVPGELAGCC
jgi:hypothetical protein